MGHINYMMLNDQDQGVVPIKTEGIKATVIQLPKVDFPLSSEIFILLHV